MLPPFQNEIPGKISLLADKLSNFNIICDSYRQAVRIYYILIKNQNKIMKTTLYIRTDIWDQIISAARLNGVSASEMIIRLIKEAMKDIKNPGRLGKMVQYQKRRPSFEWCTQHVRMPDDVYEYWLDLRKLLKMSVSLILADAVKKYLGKPMKISKGDNYRFTNYMIMKEVIDSVIIWKFIWGIPPNLEQLFRSEGNNIRP